MKSKHKQEPLIEQIKTSKLMHSLQGINTQSLVLHGYGDIA